ncbi:hypothetical protein ABZ801_31445 [Actinomadura sp. NPDC047616]|uniref:hypothetical protein n=1 Tax=Actinomadura sp. NPDC047616 TaxID=3155914 RepID=UPI0033CD986E
MTRTAVRRHAMAFLVVPALALTACGGGDDDGDGGDAAPPPAVSAAPSGSTSPVPAPGSPSASAETTTPEGTPRGGAGTEAPRRRATPTVTPSAYKTLAACLEKRGVNLPELGQATAPPPGFDPVKAQEALKSCMEFLQKPGGGTAPR